MKLTTRILVTALFLAVLLLSWRVITLTRELGRQQAMNSARESQSDKLSASRDSAQAKYLGVISDLGFISELVKDSQIRAGWAQHEMVKTLLRNSANHSPQELPYLRERVECLRDGFTDMKQWKRHRKASHGMSATRQK